MAPEETLRSSDLYESALPKEFYSSDGMVHIVVLICVHCTCGQSTLSLSINVLLTLKHLSKCHNIAMLSKSNFRSISFGHYLIKLLKLHNNTYLLKIIISIRNSYFCNHNTTMQHFPFFHVLT